MIYDYVFYVLSRGCSSTDYLRSIVISKYFDPIYYGCEGNGIYTGYVYFDDGTRSSIMFRDERPPLHSHHPVLYLYSDESDLSKDEDMLSRMDVDVHLVKRGAISIHIGRYHVENVGDKEASILRFLIPGIHPINWNNISPSYIREMESLLVYSNTPFGAAVLEKYMRMDGMNILPPNESIEEMERTARSIWDSLVETIKEAINPRNNSSPRNG
jgi:hypothetical protein